MTAPKLQTCSAYFISSITMLTGFASFFVKMKFCCNKSLCLVNAANMDKTLKVKDNKYIQSLFNPLIDAFEF